MRGPAVDGMVFFEPDNARPFGRRFRVGFLSIRCLEDPSATSTVFETVFRSGEGGIDVATEVKALFKEWLLAFSRHGSEGIIATRKS